VSDWFERLQAQLQPPRALLPGQEVWIFGGGLFGRALAQACAAQGIRVRGFIQTAPTTKSLDGLPVTSWCGLSAHDFVCPLLIGIHNYLMPMDGLVQLAQQAGFRTVLPPWDSYAQFSAALGWRYWLSSPQYLAHHADDLRRTHSRLADDTSQQCLERVVAFRMGLDLEYAGFAHPEPQYFNAITLPPLRENAASLRYLDGGAYNGDSLLQLLQLASVERAWLFEPDPANFALLRLQVGGAKVRGHCVPLGLSDRYAVLRFGGQQGMAGTIRPDGDDCISTVAVDDLLAGEGIDLLKLDIEGAEAAALRGAAHTLRSSRPVLAISAYHKPDDLWQLPDLISDICPDYTCYLRQHASNSFDLVLYAVPNSR